MAVSQDRRLTSPAQSRAPKTASPITQKTSRRRKRKALPLMPPAIVTKHGKTTIRRLAGRSFHRFEEAKGKTLDYIEFFTMGEFHCIDVSFADKTAMHLVIEPSFTLATDYADWKTGNWRGIKRWPPIRSASFNS
jgi:hypothetical protein